MLGDVCAAAYVARRASRQIKNVTKTGTRGWHMSLFALSFSCFARLNIVRFRLAFFTVPYTAIPANLWSIMDKRSTTFTFNFILKFVRDGYFGRSQNVLFVWNLIKLCLYSLYVMFILFKWVTLRCSYVLLQFSHY